MTSPDAARALLRELTYVEGRAQAAGGRFAFATDFDSTSDFPDLPYDPTASSARYADAARPEVEAVLDASADAIATRVPPAFAFVNAHLERVLVRRSDTVGGASSSSNRDRVGTCVLTNIERPSDRLLVCNEALVHEAVHQYLYRLEQRDGAFCDLAATRRHRSPWSGNRIPLHSLVHASFVYLALLGLWCRYAPTLDDANEAGLVRDRIARILFGYGYLRPMLDDPSFPQAAVQPAILAAIRDVADATRASDLRIEESVSLRAALRYGNEPPWLDRLARALVDVGEAVR